MEESGRFGGQALAFLQDLNQWARRRRLESGAHGYKSQQARWRQELSATLHFTLAGFLRDVLSHAGAAWPQGGLPRALGDPSLRRED